jgi:hypothetical protein
MTTRHIIAHTSVIKFIIIIIIISLTGFMGKGRILDHFMQMSKNSSKLIMSLPFFNVKLVREVLSSE